MGKYAKYAKKYNSDWEKLPCFSGNYNHCSNFILLIINNIITIILGWLQRASDLYADKGEAFCKLCKTALRAHKTDLIKHAKTKMHSQRADSLNLKKQPILSSFGELYIHIGFIY